MQENTTTDTQEGSQNLPKTVKGFDPFLMLPRGRVLTLPQFKKMWELARQLRRPLNEEEIVGIVGEPLPPVVMKRIPAEDPWN